MIELEHSPIGGSSAHRVLNCHWSFLEHRRQLAADDFENITSEYAERGTGAHELGAVCLADKTEPYEYVGREFNGYKAGFPDGIKLDAVAIYVAECRKILDEGGGVGTVYIERTIKLPSIHPLLKGTVDFGLVDHRAVWLRDYKNGEGVGVPAPNNTQLLYYALLLILSERIHIEHGRDFPVSLGIIQPNFMGLFSEPDVWVTTVGHVMDWGANVLLPVMTELMNAPLDANPEATPGDWCQFCPVLLSCGKMQNAFKTYVDGPEDWELTMLSNEELDNYYAQRTLARRFMTALESTVHHRLVTGTATDFKSAKLVDKQTARVWKPGAMDAIVAKFGEKAYTERKLKSPAQIEQLSADGKALALEYGYKADANGTSVAPMSDSRPAITPKTNAHVFASFASETKPENTPIDMMDF